MCLDTPVGRREGGCWSWNPAPCPCGNQLFGSRGEIRIFEATRGQQSVSDGEAWLWAGRPSLAPPASLGSAPGEGRPHPCWGCAEVPEMARADKSLGLGSPVQPSLGCWKQGLESVGSTRHHRPWQIVRPPTGAPLPASCKAVCARGSASLLWASGCTSVLEGARL